MTESNAVTESTPRKPVHRSYGEIIRLLTNDARVRVKATQQPPQVPPVVVPPGAKRILARLRAKHASIRRLKAQLTRHYGLEVYDGGSGTPHWSSERRNAFEREPKPLHRRLTVIKRLQVRATLDTMDMTPPQAKKYFLALATKLDQV